MKLRIKIIILFLLLFTGITGTEIFVILNSRSEIKNQISESISGEVVVDSRELIMTVKNIKNTASFLENKIKYYLLVTDSLSAKLSREIMRNDIRSIQREIMLLEKKNTDINKYFFFNKHNRLLAIAPFTRSDYNEIYEYSLYQRYLKNSFAYKRAATFYYYLIDKKVKKTEYINRAKNGQQSPFKRRNIFHDFGDKRHKFLTASKFHNPKKKESILPDFIFATPSYDLVRSYMGMIGITIQWQQLKKYLISHLNDNLDMFFIINKNGYLIDYPDETHIGEKVINRVKFLKSIINFKKRNKDYIETKNRIYIPVKLESLDWIIVGVINKSKFSSGFMGKKLILDIIFIIGIILINLILFVICYTLIDRTLLLFIEQLIKTIKGFLKGSSIRMFKIKTFKELENVSDSFNAMLTGIKRDNIRNKVSSKIIGKYSINTLIHNPEIIEANGNRKELTVLYYSIQNDKDMGNKSDEIYENINTWQNLVADAANEYKGYLSNITSFSGLLIFGVFDDNSVKENAIKCAEEIIKLTELFYERTGIDVKIGIGISSGECYYNLITTINNGMELLFSGDVLGMAQRIERIAKSNVIIIAKNSFIEDTITYKVLKKVDIKIRHTSKPVPVYVIKS